MGRPTIPAPRGNLGRQPTEQLEVGPVAFGALFARDGLVDQIGGVANRQVVPCSPSTLRISLTSFEHPWSHPRPSPD